MCIIDSELRDPGGDNAAYMDIVRLDRTDSSDFARQIAQTSNLAWKHEFVGHQGLTTNEQLDDVRPTEADRHKQIAAINRHNHVYVANIVAPYEHARLVAGVIAVQGRRPNNPLRPRHPHISELAVHPDYQSKGIGSLLLNRALRPYSDRSRVSAPILRENGVVMGLADSLGFIPHRSGRTGRLLGGETKVHEVFVEAPSVGTVRAIAESIYESKEQLREQLRNEAWLRRHPGRVPPFTS